MGQSPYKPREEPRKQIGNPFLTVDMGNKGIKPEWTKSRQQDRIYNRLYLREKRKKIEFVLKRVEGESSF